MPSLTTRCSSLGGYLRPCWCSSFAGASDGSVATPPFMRKRNSGGRMRAAFIADPEAGARALIAADFYDASGKGGARSWPP